ncbi:RluA family pseudouridine synthase [Mobilibacterium timonense]|uniref:RluA family pseudouridine synthase n=1 Tax=Mobilibacterium timonense TaxID=1871012 RepID=UPI003A90D29D
MNKAKYKYTVTTGDDGKRVAELLRSEFKFSHRFRTRMKFDKLVDLNGQPVPSHTVVHPGDIISIRLPEEKSDFPPEDIPISVLFEDDDLLIVNKQPGITVHPTKGHPYHTLANGIQKYMEDTHQSFKIRFANRIDMDTTGIVIVAKNSNAQNEISTQLRARNVVKEYTAVVRGVIPEDQNDFTIDLPIGRPIDDNIHRAVLPDGKPAVTDVHVLERFRDTTLVRLTLHTGRTHQIRVHMAHIGYPLVGDPLYGTGDGMLDRQALHSTRIVIHHPVSGDILDISAPLPEDMAELIDGLRAQMK